MGVVIRGFGDEIAIVMEGGRGNVRRSLPIKTPWYWLSFFAFDLDLTVHSSKGESTRYPRGNMNHVREDEEGLSPGFPSATGLGSENAEKERGDGSKPPVKQPHFIVALGVRAGGDEPRYFLR